ncbi:MAG TPA: DUF6788 family protein [Terriglobales bacterium]|nr:DUF6788 family protein [Terriglobales bacterium]
MPPPRIPPAKTPATGVPSNRPARCNPSAALTQIGFFCKGTVLKRMMKCGKAQCACASDATKRHGPYYELTYKANGKTVNVKLSPQAAPLYKAAAQQYRKLKTLLNRLDKLSKTILSQQAKLAESKPQD